MSQIAWDWTLREVAAECRREAKASTERNKGHIQSDVLAAIRRSEAGLTCDEVEVRLCLSHQTASARINELKRGWKIASVGKRKTRSGRNATVWAAR